MVGEESQDKKMTMDQYEFLVSELAEIKDGMRALNCSINGNGNRGIKGEVLLNTDFRCRYQPILDRLTLKLMSAVVSVGLIVGGVVYALLQQ